VWSSVRPGSPPGARRWPLLRSLGIRKRHNRRSSDFFLTHRRRSGRARRLRNSTHKKPLSQMMSPGSSAGGVIALRPGSADTPRNSLMEERRRSPRRIVEGHSMAVHSAESVRILELSASGVLCRLRTPWASARRLSCGCRWAVRRSPRKSK
jgi:hypothetical protein